jgi:stage II sporulation protein D
VRKNIFYSIIVIWFIAGCAPKIKKEIVEVGPSVRIHLATIDSNDVIFFKNTFYLIAEEARYEFGERNQSITIVPLTNGIQLYNANRNLLYHDYFPITIAPEDDNSHFLFRGTEYSGSIIFDSASDTSLYAVNKLPLEEYLKGVVPAEITSTKTEYFEALKAQAICCRTYAISKLEKSKNNPFDLYSSTLDQVYNGYKNHTPLADQAISDTKGTIITYNGKPAHVYYHSTCGGRLEAAENLWPEQNFHYLKSGIDAVSDKFSCSISPYFRWTEERSIEQLDSAFWRQFNRSVLQQPILDTLNLKFILNITKRHPSGRVAEVELTYADTTITLQGYKIRRFFAQPPTQYLKSSLFYFSQTNDSTLTIHGAGYGHGVGMCQFGALFMAKQGFPYYQILNKYFPGTKLSKVYN